MSTPDETWTVGEAARYLNAGGINFRFTPRRVRRWADNPECQIRAVQLGDGTWRRVLASTVRAERARLLEQAGRRDPQWPPADEVAEKSAAGGEGDPPDRV